MIPGSCLGSRCCGGLSGEDSESGAPEIEIPEEEPEGVVLASGLPAVLPLQEEGGIIGSIRSIASSTECVMEHQPCMRREMPLPVDAVLDGFRVVAVQEEQVDRAVFPLLGSVQGTTLPHVDGGQLLRLKDGIQVE